MWLGKEKKKKAEEKEKAKSKSAEETRVLSNQLREQNGELGRLRSKVRTKHQRILEKAEECLKKIRSNGLSKA